MSSSVNSAKYNLGRRVFSRTDAKKCSRGRCPPSVFLLPEKEIKISVDILDQDEKVAKIAEIESESRKRTFYGWAALSRDNACAENRIFKVARTKVNPHHALIILPDEAKLKREIQKEHATDLAQKSSWRGSPLPLKQTEISSQ